ncbi:MAG: acetylhydrolase, partial [Gammaproteobacteria bacterium]|nr:acetylhydrolase [Gammaproteobacteria bacterium]
MNSLITPGCLLLMATLMNFAAHAAEQLYSDQPSVTPELANSGEYRVGVTTMKVTHPEQLNTADFTTLKDRPLTLEVWYPASPGADAIETSYKNVTRSGKQFELQADAFRDAPVLADNASFPLIVISHGYTGYRTILFYLAEHLASHGYVVVGIDHTDSTNAEIDFSKAPGVGIPSTLIHRARDQQFVLDYFSTRNSSVTNLADTDKAGVI